MPATQPVFRFAPSPNGPLHLGHALSALLNAGLAQRHGGRFLLRIEDIDPVRTREEHVRAIEDDLRWLGLTWEEPALRQSAHLARYAAGADRLLSAGALYGCRCSRGEIAAAVRGREVQDGRPWPRDPDGAPLYPRTCRACDPDRGDWRGRLALRLKEDAGGGGGWTEVSLPGLEPQRVVSGRDFTWGDVVVARRDTPASYHLAVVFDDALQGVTHVVRGQDLFAATAIHARLQILLGLPQPLYAHHPLVLDAQGNKLSKSAGSVSLRQMRAEGATPADIRRLSGADAIIRG